MTAKVTLYSRQDCCLCEEMKKVVIEVAAKIPLELAQVNVDASPELQEQFGNQVPVLFIDGRKAFKYRLTARELKKKLAPTRRSLFARFGPAVGKEEP